ncbi:DUF977 family protein [[Enterobacter] lignolyticus]|uniref:DUF977 family protein n=1 Tax=Enterobacter lignolyticus (strain SCF1) TaxID=701347 RepID=E3G2R8_ENTLS|nr:DUF977 family protein [[Enterobacter] lignolyticus]ADO48099.1 protein of unknown function DUF977 [[Enterobacter] lignolyticus SCF1]
MARPKTPEQKSACIGRIIELTRQHGRLTVKQASAILGLNRGTTEKYFREAATGGEVVRHGRLGLFRDQRAIIDFDLQRYSYRRSPTAAATKQDFSKSPVMGRVFSLYGAGL